MYWKLLAYRDYKKNTIEANYQCSECGYIIKDMFVQKRQRQFLYLVNLPEFVDTCPNCGAKTTIEEYFDERDKEFKAWSKQMDKDINQLWCDLITEKKIKLDKRYI